ncbi:MAG: PadR family transcriptional regulator [Clostridiales bacterium]|nr:PadR family transcriptional regulator [Clostridiales bacterium]
MAESDLIRGNVDTIILKILYEGDRYGYDLIRQINARSDGQWEIKQPTVYACLKRLEKQGFISSYWDNAESDGGRRKYYSLTDSGREVFLKYKNEFERTTALFGELITGNEPAVFIQPDNDFSDVEDDGYALPKRKPKPRPKKPKEEAAPLPPIEEQASPVIDEPIIEETEQEAAEPVVSYEPEPEKFVQTDIFSLTQTEEAETEAADEPAEILDEDETADEFNNEYGQAEEPDEQEIPQTVTALDPRSIIDRCYNNERGRSYADEYRRYEEAPTKATRPTPPPPAPVQTQQPAPVVHTEPPAPIPQPAPPAPVQTAMPAPAQSKQVYTPPREDIGFSIAEEESPARREYKTVLSDLVDRSQIARPAVREQPVQAEQAAIAAAEEPTDERFARIRQAALDMGNDVQIREHNNSAREYTRRYRYYSNRLLMTHYTIMCASMFLVGLILFLTFYVGLKMRMKYDYVLYIVAGLFPILLFITAVIRFAGDPDRTKRINVNFKFSIIIRCVVMVQVAVVIYCLNLIWGMPIAFSVAYVPSLVIPLAYALFIPISEVIFMSLLKTGNYADGTIEYVAEDAQ